MASESSEDRVVSVALPPELNDWIDEKATELGVNEDELVVQLLASYRATDELDETDDPGELLGPEPDLESAVRDVIAGRIPDIARAVGDHLDSHGDDLAAVEDHVEEEVDGLQDEISRVESSFQSKLEDVRERVIQVKKETDQKAPADHSHDELEALATIRAQLEELEARVDDVDSTVERQREDIDAVEADLEEMADVQSRLAGTEDKLNTIAWVVSDLRDDLETQRGTERAVEELKQRAAKADVDRALCDNCENAVDIALLTEPVCPHCETAVNGVRLPGGFFGKPRLSVAKQLEAGDQASTQNQNVPDAAQR